MPRATVWEMEAELRCGNLLRVVPCREGGLDVRCILWRREIFFQLCPWSGIEVSRWGDCLRASKDAS